MNSKIKFLGLAIIGAMVLVSSCNKDNDEATFTGTLSVLQKDAYSEIAGRTSDLWPPHTTVVFNWENGNAVQLNHGTAPDEKDANGDLYLVEAKVFTFEGTKSQMEELQTAFEGAIYDDDNHVFLSFTNGEPALESAFILGIGNYLLDGANGFPSDGDITKEELVDLLLNGEFKEFAQMAATFSWGEPNWTIALESVLMSILGADQEQFNNLHVCNDDADLQVKLIKNYIATGKIEVPLKVNNGPKIFYIPDVDF